MLLGNQAAYEGEFSQAHSGSLQETQRVAIPLAVTIQCSQCQKSFCMACAALPFFMPRLPASPMVWWEGSPRVMWIWIWRHNLQCLGVHSSDACWRASILILIWFKEATHLKTSPGCADKLHQQHFATTHLMWSKDHLVLLMLRVKWQRMEFWNFGRPATCWCLAISTKAAPPQLSKKTKRQGSCRFCRTWHVVFVSNMPRHKLLGDCWASQRRLGTSRLGGSPGRWPWRSLSGAGPKTLKKRPKPSRWPSPNETPVLDKSKPRVKQVYPGHFCVYVQTTRGPKMAWM